MRVLMDSVAVELKKKNTTSVSNSLFHVLNKLNSLLLNSPALTCCLVYLAGVFPAPAALKGILDVAEALVRNSFPGRGRMV